MQLLPHNEQASRKLLPVGRIVTNRKSFFTLSDDKFGDVHNGLFEDTPWGEVVSPKGRVNLCQDHASGPICQG